MMYRIRNHKESNDLAGKQIVVTGCGFHPLKHEFYDSLTKNPTHDEVIINDKPCKLNIGSTTAALLATQGARVVMVSTSEKKLKALQSAFQKNIKESIDYVSADLLHSKGAKTVVDSIDKTLETHWVQAVGLGGGAYQLKDNNPYLMIEETPVELINMESRSILSSTHILMQKFLPLFKKQNETKVVVVTSMSAIRSYSLGASHCSSKAALDQLINSYSLALFPFRIYVTRVRPGLIDTGFYDKRVQQEAVVQTGKEYGCNWERNTIPLAPPYSVASSISHILTSDAHIPSINLVAKGQFPNEGS